jgi:hypothetical protein
VSAVLTGHVDLLLRSPHGCSALPRGF